MGRAGVLNVGDVRKTENPGRGMHHLARQVVFPSRKKGFVDCEVCPHSPSIICRRVGEYV
jgi:hypothetical protein